MNNKDNLMILGKDRRSLEQEGFEDDEVEELEEYVLGDDKFDMKQKLSTSLSLCRQLSYSLYSHTRSLEDPILKKDSELHTRYLEEIQQELRSVMKDLEGKD